MHTSPVLYDTHSVLFADCHVVASHVYHSTTLHYTTQSYQKSYHSTAQHSTAQHSTVSSIYCMENDVCYNCAGFALPYMQTCKHRAAPSTGKGKQASKKRTKVHAIPLPYHVLHTILARTACCVLRSTEGAHTIGTVTLSLRSTEGAHTIGTVPLSLRWPEPFIWSAQAIREHIHCRHYCVRAPNAVMMSSVARVHVHVRVRKQVPSQPAHAVDDWADVRTIP